jgi:toxin ParE1/3/4
MSVVIEEKALDDLVEIHEWIAADDPPAADSTVERIFDAIDRLGRFPLIGHKGRARDTFEWVVTESSHVIVYGLDRSGDLLAVVCVFRSSQENRRP